MNTRIKKGDTVKVLSGDDKGKTGKVVKVFPKKGTAVVEGIRMRKKHQRSRQSEKKGQIIEFATPIRLSKLSSTDKKS